MNFAFLWLQWKLLQVQDGILEISLWSLNSVLKGGTADTGLVVILQ
jgi:hypothetical protein